MPAKPRTQLSKPQLETYIRSAALQTSNVVFTKHVLQQMKTRRISAERVLAVLRSGRIWREPEANPMYGTLECRMEHRNTQDAVAVIVALSDDDPSLLLITAMYT